MSSFPTEKVQVFWGTWPDDSWAVQMMTAQIRPFQICPKFVQKDTPGTYLSTFPKGVSLDKTMKVCRIQDTHNEGGKAGAVAPGITADYPEEAETITLGFAPGKAYDSVGIGRHGNFTKYLIRID